MKMESTTLYSVIIKFESIYSVISFEILDKAPAQESASIAALLFLFLS